SAPSSTDTTISYSFGGTADGATDYTNTTTSVTIAAGETTATITVPTTDDNLVEDSESLSLTLVSTDNPQITLGATTVATGMIDANERATVSISDAATVSEGAQLTFTVMLSAPSSTDTTINYSLGGTADGATDYTNTTTSVTIAAGETTATITVPTI